ncbi:innate immunity activator protein isoform X2 [Paroedura picta]|uniref:innate immunity activator protein isoform X2 n=1 Tax=Paroedura picta TaxID=143630 RepID=UPI004056E73B
MLLHAASLFQERPLQQDWTSSEVGCLTPPPSEAAVLRRLYISQVGSYFIIPPPLELAMKSKDETSDTDSGIIMQSGPDSPVSPMKDLTQAMRKQQRMLEERLEACVQELKRLCLREAELTGMLPSEYPLKAGEKPPKVRRRIGAAFKLDEKAILSRGVDPVSTLERDLALQLQIAEAARCLSREENLTKQVRKRRKSAVLKEEKKLKDLEQALNEYRLAARHLTALRASAPVLEGFSASDESSLSDVVLAEEGPQELNSHPPSKLTSSAHLQPFHGSSAQPSPASLPEGQIHYQPTELECAPIQNSPWKETSLDKPYEKTKKPSEPSNIPRICSSREGLESRGRSALPRRRPTYYTVTVPDYCFSAPKPNPAIKPPYHCTSEDSNSDVSSISYTTSAGSSSPDISFLKPLPPPPAEEPLQRFQSQVCKGHEAEYHSQCPQKLLSPPGYFPAMEYASECLLPAGREPCYGRPAFLSASSAHFAYKDEAVPLRFHRPIVSQSRVVRTPSLKDSLPCSSTGARVLSKSAVTEELKSWHERTRLRNARPHSLDRQGAFRMRSGPGRELLTACSMGQQAQVPRVHILKRSPEGAPVQVYVPENGEIITQV